MNALGGNHQRESRARTAPGAHGLVVGSGENDLGIGELAGEETNDVNLIAMALECRRDTAQRWVLYRLYVNFVLLGRERWPARRTGRSNQRQDSTKQYIFHHRMLEFRWATNRLQKGGDCRQ